MAVLRATVPFQSRRCNIGNEFVETKVSAAAFSAAWSALEALGS
jgi:hypothetical protein